MNPITPVPISRRGFLKWALRTGTFAGLLLALPRSGGRLWAAPRSDQTDIAVARGDIRGSVKAVIDELGGIGSFVRKGQKVLVKPNMSFPNPPEWGTTTNPEVVAALCELCIAAGAAQVLIVDNPLRRPDLCLRRSGIKAAVRDLPRTHVLAATDRSFYTQASVPGAIALDSVLVLRDALDIDVLINVPIAKSHNAAGVSLGMKNLMGLIWNRDDFHEQYDLNQAIADLSRLIRPDLIVVDASRTLITGGPSGPGTVVPVGRIVAGTDPVAVDSYSVSLARWYGRSFQGRNVRHVLHAAEQGLGQIDTTKLKIRQISA